MSQPAQSIANAITIVELILPGSRLMRRAMKLELKSDNTLSIIIGAMARGALDPMWAWANGRIFPECHLVFNDKKNVYSFLWIDGASFDVTHTEALKIREVFAQFKLRIEAR